MENNINVLAIDQVENEIKFLNENYSRENIMFIADDFTNLSNPKKENIKFLDCNFDYVYSRFTFHSINENKENNALNWIKNTLEPGGLFLLEARSINDPMFKKGKILSETENYTNHYRRYMEFNKFIEKLKSRNFKINYSIESDNLAVYKDDNPVVIRIIAEKM